MLKALRYPMLYRNHRALLWALLIAVGILGLVLWWPAGYRNRNGTDAAILFEKTVRERVDIKAKHVETFQLAISRISDEDLKRATQIVYWICPSADDCLLQAPFFDMGAKFRVSKQYKLNACAIYKNMSTVLTAIMCYLFDSTLIRDASNFRNQWNSNRSCIGKNEFWVLRDVENLLGDRFSKLNNFALVREPMERFLSGLINQCTELERCGECKDAACLLGMLDENGRETVRTGDFRLGHRGYSVEEHVNLHFLPQSWQCKFDRYLNDYQLLKYTSSDTDGIAAQMSALFKQVGVSAEEIDFIEEQLKGGRSIHSTLGNEKRTRAERELTHSPALMRRFMALFFFDYILLGFPLPRVEAIPF
ncbi:unnamed protein product, partial [Mesorhabditis spiculigera]